MLDINDMTEEEREAWLLAYGFDLLETPYEDDPDIGIDLNAELDKYWSE